MAKQTHINITMDFSNWNNQQYDLRIPIQLTVKQLLLNLMETLDIPMPEQSMFVVKVRTKHILLADDDYLHHFPVNDGDVLVAL